MGDETDAFIDRSRGAESADEIDLKNLRERAKSETTTPYSIIEVEETVGTTPEPDFDSSPDVAVDGSIARENETVEVTSKEREEISTNRTAILVAALVLLFVIIGILASV